MKHGAGAWSKQKPEASRSMEQNRGAEAWRRSMEQEEVRSKQKHEVSRSMGQIGAQ
jgi:hypothetical protein